MRHLVRLVMCKLGYSPYHILVTVYDGPCGRAITRIELDVTWWANESDARKAVEQLKREVRLS